MKQQQGFTLLEILIAVFIFAVGFLGAGALQMASLQSNQNNYYRTQAIFLANEIADQMRSNLDASKSGTAFNAINTSNSSTIPTANTTCRNSSNGCTPTEFANITIAQWAELFNSNTSTLPNGSGSISRAGANSNDFTITIRWNEKDWQGNTNRRSAQERTHTLVITL